MEVVDRHDIDGLALSIHEISTSKGFTPPSLDNLPEKLMLSVSELAEALEEHRASKPLVYFEGEERKPEGILVEIGDSVIRNLHMMHSLIEQAGPDFEYTISDVLAIKVAFNANRPAMHGKTY